MDTSDRAWHYADDDVLVGKIVAGQLDNNVFLVACARTNDAVIVDAAAEPERILELAAGTNVTAILTTHGHWDHVGAAAHVASALNVPIHIGAADAAMAKLAETSALEAGTLPVGDVELEVIPSPGHTPGSHCFRVGHLIFTGDTLFPGGPGATGSPASFKQIMETLDTKLFTAPDETVILPGHGADTTIGQERPSVEEWRQRGW